MIYKSARYIFTLLIILISATNCNREKQVPIPYVMVNYAVYLSNPSNAHLRVPGNYLILPDEGNLGIILYRKTLGNPDDFIALDLTCSNEPLEQCKLAVDSTGFYLVCPCCRSEFSIWDGLVAKGPAKWPLREYATSMVGNTVRIYN